MDKKLKSKIISSLREIWLQSELRRNAVKAATSKIEIGKFKNGKPKFLNHIECNICKRMTAEKDKEHQVDHIDPVIHPDTGFAGWDNYINRLLDCGADNLQVLCKRCHAIKTKREKS